MHISNFYHFKIAYIFHDFSISKGEKGCFVRAPYALGGGPHCADIITQNSSSKGEKYRDTYHIENPVSYRGIRVSS